MSYSAPNDAYVKKRVDALQILFTDYLNKHGPSFISDVKIDVDRLWDCVSRVHQREYYYDVFHDMPHGISEAKRISLYCFWIQKYCPFFVGFNIPKQNKILKDFWSWRAKYFVERFGMYLFTMTMRSVYRNQGVSRLPLSNEGINNFVYSLHHHDVSKESLTAIFEMLEDVIKQIPKVPSSTAAAK